MTPIWTATSGGGTSGAEPDIVLVHGSLDRSAGMLKLSRQLDTGWRVTRYDRRGYGRSIPCEGPFTVDAQVADLLYVIDHAVGRGGPVVVFGHSFGGNVALTLAARQPELVRAVIVYESPLSWVDWWPAESAGNIAVSTHGGADAAAEAFMRRLIGNRRWERLPEATRAARRSEGPAMLAELADLRRARPWDPARVAVPVLALYGEHARPHHVRAMHTVAQLVPNGRLAMVPGAHHFGPSTHAAQVAELINEFVGDGRHPAG